MSEMSNFSSSIPSEFQILLHLLFMLRRKITCMDRRCKKKKACKNLIDFLNLGRYLDCLLAELDIYKLKQYIKYM